MAEANERIIDKVLNGLIDDDILNPATGELTYPSPPRDVAEQRRARVLEKWAKGPRLPVPPPTPRWLRWLRAAAAMVAVAALAGLATWAAVGRPVVKPAAPPSVAKLIRPLPLPEFTDDGPDNDKLNTYDPANPLIMPQGAYPPIHKVIPNIGALKIERNDAGTGHAITIERPFGPVPSRVIEFRLEYVVKVSETKNETHVVRGFVLLRKGDPDWWAVRDVQDDTLPRGKCRSRTLKFVHPEDLTPEDIKLVEVGRKWEKDHGQDPADWLEIIPTLQRL